MRGRILLKSGYQGRSTGMGLFHFLIVVQAIIAAALVGVILMQRSEGGGLGVGGSPSGLMSARGAADFLTRTTSILALLFILMSITLAVVSSNKGRPGAIDSSFERSRPAAPAAQPPVDPAAIAPAADATSAAEPVPAVPAAPSASTAPQATTTQPATRPPAAERTAPKSAATPAAAPVPAPAASPPVTSEPAPAAPAITIPIQR